MGIPLAWAVTVAAALAGLGWLALAVRLVLILRKNLPISPAAGPAPADAPAVAAVVAARDEEREVRAAVASIAAQEYPDLVVRVVDDQSTDRTGTILDELAADPAYRGRLRIIHGAERPAGWVGKTWAVQQGAADAGDSAPWLWFVDGDMVLHPRALATAIAEAQRTGADLVSFLPRADCRGFWQGATALMLTQLLTHVYPIAHVNDPARPDALAAGGFLLIRRSTYERIGGHAAVRGEIVEDIQLARRVKVSGGRITLRAAPELASTHMYGTLGEIWRGLRKNAYAGMEYRFHAYLTGAIVSLAMAWAPPLALAMGGLIAWFGARPTPAVAFAALGIGALGWIAQALASAPFILFLRLRPWLAFSLPAGISLYVAIATSSVWHYHRGRVLWKGRSYAPRDVIARVPDRPRDGT